MFDWKVLHYIIENLTVLLLLQDCTSSNLYVLLQNTEDRNFDLVQVYKSYFERNVNPINLALFIDIYVHRTDLNIQRVLDPSKRKDACTLHMPVLNITGSRSPHVDDTITLNGRLDPTSSSWMKVCCQLFKCFKNVVLQAGKIKPM